MIWIFTAGESDGIKSRIFSLIFSTLLEPLPLLTNEIFFCYFDCDRRVCEWNNQIILLLLFGKACIRQWPARLLLLLIETWYDSLPDLLTAVQLYLVRKHDQFLKTNSICCPWVWWLLTLTHDIFLKHYYTVHIFWEGQNVLRNLHRRFVLCSASQI